MTTLAEDIEAQTASYLSALKSNSDEIARLAEALRKAEADRNEYRNARDRAEKSRADDYRQQTETVRALLEQRDAACADSNRWAKLYSEAMHLEYAARVDAERLEAQVSIAADAYRTLAAIANTLPRQHAVRIYNALPGWADADAALAAHRDAQKVTK